MIIFFDSHHLPSQFMINGTERAAVNKLLSFTGSFSTVLSLAGPWSCVHTVLGQVKYPLQPKESNELFYILDFTFKTTYKRTND